MATGTRPQVREVDFSRANEVENTQKTESKGWLQRLKELFGNNNGYASGEAADRDARLSQQSENMMMVNPDAANSISSRVSGQEPIPRD